MMQKKILLFILIISFSLQAQNEPFYLNYQWETNPNYQVEESDKDMIALKDKVVTEFYFESQELVEYYLEHKIIWLNSDDRIEEYNKVYLPYSNNASLLVNKARVLKKNGDILELDASKILTAENEETGRKYKYFAFEGIEKGSFIEYYYVEKRFLNIKELDLMFKMIMTNYRLNLTCTHPVILYLILRALIRSQKSFKMIFQKKNFIGNLSQKMSKVLIKKKKLLMQRLLDLLFTNYIPTPTTTASLLHTRMWQIISTIIITQLMMRKPQSKSINLQNR